MLLTSGHPLLFYLDDGKTQIYLVPMLTTNGTPGQGRRLHTNKSWRDYTPNVLYYPM